MQPPFASIAALNLLKKNLNSTASLQNPQSTKVLSCGFSYSALPTGFQQGLVREQGWPQAAWFSGHWTISVYIWIHALHHYPSGRSNYEPVAVSWQRQPSFNLQSLDISSPQRIHGPLEENITNVPLLFVGVGCQKALFFISSSLEPGSSSL